MFRAMMSYVLLTGLPVILVFILRAAGILNLFQPVTACAQEKIAHDYHDSECIPD